MLSSIHPLGERARGNKWGATVTYYLVGSIIGGVAMGAALGGVGELLNAIVKPQLTTVGWIVVAACVLSALLDLLPVSVPSPERQVSEAWMGRYRSWVYAGGFGFQLGMGVTTFVKTASIYLLWLLALLSGSVMIGMAIGGWFGLLRGAALLTVSRVRDPGRLREYFKKMASLARPADAFAVTAPLVAAAAAILAADLL